MAETSPDITQPDQQQGLPGVGNPKAGHVPIATITKMFRNPWNGETITERSVQEWVEKGYFPRSDFRGLYHLMNVIGGVYWKQRELINKKKGIEGEELDSLEVREQRAKTEKAEIEVARLRGELIPTDAAKAEMFNAARRTRDSIENIPPRIAALLASETDEHKIKEMLSHELKQALEGLSK